MAHKTRRTHRRTVGYAVASVALLASVLGVVGASAASATTTPHKVNVEAATAIEYAVNSQPAANPTT